VQRFASELPLRMFFNWDSAYQQFPRIAIEKGVPHVTFPAMMAQVKARTVGVCSPTMPLIA